MTPAPHDTGGTQPGFSAAEEACTIQEGEWKSGPCPAIPNGMASCNATATHLASLSCTGDAMLERQFALAQLLAERGRPQDALAALEPLLTQQPSHVEALCLKGRCLANNKPLVSWQSYSQSEMLLCHAI